MRPVARRRSLTDFARESRIAQRVIQPDSLNLVVGLTLGLLVCAPFLGGVRVFLLDWTLGPHAALVTPATLGLNGLTSGVAASYVVSIANQLLGAVATWLPLFIFFPIATVGAGRLAGRSPMSRLAAGTLYAVNPFVFNRIYAGHLLLLIGYALLPWAAVSALRAFSGHRGRWITTALWWTVLTALSPHFSWIFGLVILGALISTYFIEHRAVRSVISRLIAIVAAFVAMNLYIIWPHLVTSLPTSVGSVSMDLYRTASDPHLGLFANVLALYGFWRLGPGPTLPKDIIAGWPFLMFAILLIVGAGVRRGLRPDQSDVALGTSDEHFTTVGEEATRAALTTAQTPSARVSPSSSPLRSRTLAVTLIIVGVCGYFLALGSQGPTGAVFTWMYNSVPFFAIMREPQKFVMLLALAMAVFFGWGIERVAHLGEGSSRRTNLVVAILLGVALPLGYSANIFDGLGGQLSTSRVPGAYEQANTLMGSGVGNVVSFPWHLYMAYPFTNGRVVANIAPSTFERPVISGDNVQSGGVSTQSTSQRSSYIEGLLAHSNEIHHFGALVAPLGVKYVALAKAVDWTSYQWLGHQSDLRLILNTPALEVWRNLTYAGVGTPVARVVAVTSVRDLINASNAPTSLSVGAVAAGTLTNLESGGVGSISGAGTATSSRVRELSPVAYRISPGRPGWVEVAAPYQRGWSINGRAAVMTAQGTLLVRVGARGGVLRFTPWAVVRLSYAVSPTIFVGLAAISVWARRRQRTRT
ncbi:MAG: hypothetical protein HKL85_03960 [Acidimicrobiaceae bacterium]|nr:hypothetical protein [Acidimicrobiaceae bacterium]